MKQDEQERNENSMMIDEIACCYNDIQACIQCDPDLLDPPTKGMKK